MNNFLIDLHHYISCNALPIRNDPEYNQAFKEYLEIEAELKEKIGADLLFQYQDAWVDVSYRQDLAIFSHTLRFCQQFFQTVLD